MEVKNIYRLTNLQESGSVLIHPQNPHDQRVEFLFPNNNFDDEKDKYTSIVMSTQTFFYIFGEGIIHCLDSSIDSKFEFDNIYPIDGKTDNLGTYYDYMVNKKSNKEKKKILINTKIQISNSLNMKRIQIKPKIRVGYLDNDTDSYRKMKLKENFEPYNIFLEYVDAIRLANYAAAMNKRNVEPSLMSDLRKEKEYDENDIK